MPTSPSRVPITSAPRLDVLRERFAAFRRSHAAHTRIPVELRRLALEALAAGVPSTQLARACALSHRQLEHWRNELVLSPPTILSVVDDELPSSRLASTQGIALRLRIEGSRIHIELELPRSESR